MIIHLTCHHMLVSKAICVSQKLKHFYSCEVCFSWSSEIPRHLISWYERIAKSLWTAQMSFCTLMIQNIQKIQYALLRSHFFNHVINGCGIHNFSNIRKNKKCKSYIFCFNCVTPQFLLKHTFLGSKRSFPLIKIQRSVYEILTWKSLHHIFDLEQFDRIWIQIIW